MQEDEEDMEEQKEDLLSSMVLRLLGRRQEVGGSKARGVKVRTEGVEDGGGGRAARFTVLHDTFLTRRKRTRRRKRKR